MISNEANEHERGPHNWPIVNMIRLAQACLFVRRRFEDGWCRPPPAAARALEILPFGQALD
jgi:hypothetical protein